MENKETLEKQLNEEVKNLNNGKKVVYTVIEILEKIYDEEMNQLANESLKISFRASLEKNIENRIKKEPNYTSQKLKNDFKKQLKSTKKKIKDFIYLIEPTNLAFKPLAIKIIRKNMDFYKIKPKDLKEIKNPFTKKELKALRFLVDKVEKEHEAKKKIREVYKFILILKKEYGFQDDDMEYIMKEIYGLSKNSLSVYYKRAKEKLKEQVNKMQARIYNKNYKKSE